jgi:hypothetical protein
MESIRKETAEQIKELTFDIPIDYSLSMRQTVEASFNASLGDVAHPDGPHMHMHCANKESIGIQPELFEHDRFSQREAQGVKVVKFHLVSFWDLREQWGVISTGEVRARLNSRSLIPASGVELINLVQTIGPYRLAIKAEEAKKPIPFSGIYALGTIFESPAWHGKIREGSHGVLLEDASQKDTEVRRQWSFKRNVVALSSGIPLYFRLVPYLGVKEWNSGPLGEHGSFKLTEEEVKQLEDLPSYQRAGRAEQFTPRYWKFGNWFAAVER